MAKILVAEDDPRSLELLTKNLEEWGYTVVPTSNGMEALAKTENEKFDLVVSDWMMPNLTGIELCETLKKRKSTQNIPIIMVSSIKAPEDIAKAYDAGVEKFYTKPFNRRDLQDGISQALLGNSSCDLDAKRP